MNTCQAIAKHLREIHFGKNWTASCVQDQLANVSLQEANKGIAGLNSIATLQYHMEYYLDVQIRVLEGGPLLGTDAESLSHPPYTNENDWRSRINGHLKKAEKLASLIESLPEKQLHGSFVEDKYGSYFRNLVGLIEHTHYHLGQVAVIKKLIRT